MTKGQRQFADDALDARLQRLYAAIASRDGQPGAMNQLAAICRACIDLLPVTGAGVMLMAERAHQGTLHATDTVTKQLEDLQNAVAEGPCIDSYRLGRPVLEPDLAGSGCRVWPLLAPAAVAAGIQALFSFPLQLDGASIGALNLYRDRPGPMGDAYLDDARLLAAMATREVLLLQAEGVPGTLPAKVADLSGDRASIEQATGMVAAQLDAGIVEAARCLRDVAEDLGRPLAEIAREVVARTLRLG